MPKPFRLNGPYIAPCMNCQNRHEGCHSTCESYQDFTEEKREEKHLSNERRRYERRRSY